MSRHNAHPAAEREQTTPTAARASVVNRVHRVVRQEAAQTRSRRDRQRSLWVPLAVCSSLLFVLIYAAWTLLSGYDLTPTDMPDASAQLIIMLLWLLPVTAFVIFAVWYRRLRNSHEGHQ